VCAVLRQLHRSARYSTRAYSANTLRRCSNLPYNFSHP
jgi:hypothetical protein